MIPSVRDDIDQVLGRQGLMHQGQNLSLYFSRLCKRIDEPDEPNESDKHKAKAEALEQLDAGLSSEAFQLYKRAFDKWKEAWAKNPDALCIEMICKTSLIIGMGDQNVHEFGISLQRPWGTPYIPGSAVKGVAAAYAQKNGDPEWQRNLQNSEPDGRFAEAVFGGVNAEGERCAGGLGFADAWWIPDSRTPFQKDIINVHYRKYYGGEAGVWPDGVEAPLPVQFIVIRPETRFLMVLTGPPKACQVVKQIIIAAGRDSGFGGKTRVGYGRMRYLETPQELIARVATMSAGELAALFKEKGGDAGYQDVFVQAVKQHSYAPELQDLFRKFRPAVSLLERLRREKPVDMKSAKNIRKDFDSTLSSSGIDPTDPDIQEIFNFCRSLAVQGIERTWLAAFAYGFDDMVRGKDFTDVTDILIRHLDALQSGKTDWPTFDRVRQDIKKLTDLTDDQRQELEDYVDMAFE